MGKEVQCMQSCLFFLFRSITEHSVFRIRDLLCLHSFTLLNVLVCVPQLRSFLLA